jgi:outer membrane protein OmpA-like peptidoglycan-associated protein
MRRPPSAPLARRALLAAMVLVTGVACPPSIDPRDARPPATRPPAEDIDGDGIPDHADLCPNIPEDCDGFRDSDGCPDPDNDGDGIPDVCDLCPDLAEDQNGMQDADGCPEPPALAPGADGPLVTFDWRSTKLGEGAKKLLGDVARALAGAPEIERVAVIGHAARDEPNPERTAEERAQRALEALLALGVDGRRMEAHGAADRDPLVVANDPKHGKNRRISFAILRARGVELGRWEKGGLVPGRQLAARERPGEPSCPSGQPPRAARPCRR